MAYECGATCPDGRLMCAACWATVSAASKEAVDQTRGSKGERRRAAVQLAQADAAEARGDTQTAQKHRVMAGRVRGGS
jgi:hypothetical protein